MKLSMMLALFCLAVASAAAAEQGGSRGTMNHATMNHSAMNQSSMNHAAMNHSMMNLVQEDWSTTDDIAFLSGMIAHHEGAIEMSEPMVSSADKHVRGWARDIIAAQKQEIAMMQAMLRKLGPQDQAAYDHMRDEMDAMMDMKVSDDPDANFVDLMMPHHAGAIEMSLPALVNSQNKDVREMAKRIIVDQTKEIDAFRDWSAKRRATAIAHMRHG